MARGDHAEHALAAGHELPQLRPGGARRRVARGQLAERRRDPHRDQVLVDPPAAGRGLARRAGRHAAADRRPLVALRHVAEREPVGGERAVGLRQPHAGREHAVSERSSTASSASIRAEVERDQRAERPAQRLHAADHARAAAERHDGHARLGARLQHREHLVVVRRARRPRRARPRRRPRAGRAGRRRTCRGSAARAPRDRRGTSLDELLQRRAQPRVQRRLAQPHVLERHRPVDDLAGDPELVAQEVDACSGSDGPAPGSPQPQKPARASRLPPSTGRRAPVELLARRAPQHEPAEARHPAPALAQLDRHPRARPPPAPPHLHAPLVQHLRERRALPAPAPTPAAPARCPPAAGRRARARPREERITVVQPSSLTT